MILDLNYNLVIEGYFHILLPDLFAAIIKDGSEPTALAIISTTSLNIINGKEFDVIYEVSTSKLWVVLNRIDKNSFAHIKFQEGFAMCLGESTVLVLYDIEENHFAITPLSDKYEKTDFKAVWEKLP